MNLPRVARVLAGFILFFAGVQVLPLLLSLAEETAGACVPWQGFAASIAGGLLASGLLALASRRATGGFYRRETLCVAGLAWFLAGLLGAIPLHWSGLLASPVDAVFESISGLTTCGGTVLGSAGNPTPEATPRSLLLWRAMLQWLGGIGIVLAFVAMMPSMGAAGRNLLMAESVGVSMEGFQPSIRVQARWVGLVYAGLTVACAAALMLAGDMGWFDAVCHAFTCLSTGGFSTKTSVAVFDSVGVEVVLTVFMFVGGCSFTALAGAVREGVVGLRGMLCTGEFRLYSTVTVLTVAAVAVDLVRAGMPVDAALRQASFNVVSMLSCCGYATADFHAWPPLSLVVIFACTVVGGCSGSAAGGLKQVRLLVCLRLLAHTIRSFARPKIVQTLKLDEEVLSAATVSSVLAMVLLWLLTILLGATVIAVDQRLSFVGALTASASMLGNCGPAMAAVQPEALAAGLPVLGQGVAVVGPNIGPLGGFGDLHAWTKLVMSVQMILGRLELLPLLALFAPSFWRR